MSTQQNLDWLMNDFVTRVPTVAHAVVVSADGLPMACSAGLPGDRVDQLAAIASGLQSLVQGTARMFNGGHVNQTLIDMEHGLVFVMAVSEGSALAVLAPSDSDVGLLAYEMTMLVERVGRVLTPAPRVAAPGVG